MLRINKIGHRISKHVLYAEYWLAKCWGSKSGLNTNRAIDLVRIVCFISVGSQCSRFEWRAFWRSKSAALETKPIYNSAWFESYLLPEAEEKSIGFGPRR